MSWLEHGMQAIRQEVDRAVLRSLLPKTVPIAQRARAFARLLDGESIFYTREVVVEGIEPLYVCETCGGLGDVPDPKTRSMDTPLGEPMPCPSCADEDRMAAAEVCRRTPGWEWLGLEVRWALDRRGDNPLPEDPFQYDRVQLAHPETEEVVYDRSFKGRPCFVNGDVCLLAFNNRGGEGIVLAAAAARLPQLGPTAVPCSRFHRPGQRCWRCDTTPGFGEGGGPAWV